MIAIPKGELPTVIGLTTTVFVDVSILETLLLPAFVTYANGAALAILASIETIAVDTKAIEYNLCLLAMYFNSFPILVVSKIRILLSKILNIHPHAFEYYSIYNL